MKVHHIWKWLFEMVRILLIAACGYLLLLMFFHYLFQYDTMIRYLLILIIFQLMLTFAGILAVEYRFQYLLTVSILFAMLFVLSISWQIKWIWKEYGYDDLAFYTPVICGIGIASWIFRAVTSFRKKRKSDQINLPGN